MPTPNKPENYAGENTDRKGFAVTLLCLVVAGALWHGFFIQPREDFLHAVNDCTEDASRAEWDRCHAELSNSN